MIKREYVVLLLVMSSGMAALSLLAGDFFLSIHIEDRTTAVVRLHATADTNTYTLLRSSASPFLSNEAAQAVMLGGTGDVAYKISRLDPSGAFFRARVSSAEDFDGDGVCNLDELHLGTNPEKADTDGDGMPDGWEIGQGLDPLFDEGLDDHDGDGLVNRDECHLDTNSNMADSDGDMVPDGLDPHPTTSVDDDSDGLPDDWEMYWFHNLAQSGGDDFDHDGATEEQEYGMGTDPTKTNVPDARNLVGLTILAVAD